MRGEELRAKKNPSVSELLAKRVPQIATAEPTTSNAVFKAGDATRLALALAVLVNGRWQRYYGFVGRHIIAKVPAEEIEL